MACDVIDSINDLWFRLGFLSQSDFNASDWFSVTDLYQYADHAAQRLAYGSGLFKTFDNSIAVAPSVAMPARHVFTVFAYISYGASGVQILRLTNTAQLFALDATFSVTSGPSMRLSMDAGAVGTGTFYPTPTLAGTLCQVMQQAPPTVASGASVLPLSPVLQDYFTYAILETVLSRESDHAKPEVAAHAAERMKLYEKVFQQFFGPGQ